MQIQIKEISVGWSETVSLSGYCNVRPSVSYTAIVEEGQAPAQVRMALLEIARSTVREEIDAALERDGRAPKYYEGPRFQVLYSDRRKAVIVMSDDTNDWPDACVHRCGLPRGMRLEVAREKAVDLAATYGYDYYDCSDGDYSRLPSVPDVEELLPDEELLPEGELYEEELPF